MVESRLVLSNTTPLITLAGIDQLDLLPALYGKITVPAIVRLEYLAGVRPGDPHPDTLVWLRLVADPTPDPFLPVTLGAGERAVLSLAGVTSPQAVLLDEHRGRRIAGQLGLPIVGTLGILLAAKGEGLVTSIAPLIDEMLAQGRRMSPALREHVLRAAGELS